MVGESFAVMSVSTTIAQISGITCFLSPMCIQWLQTIGFSKNAVPVGCIRKVEAMVFTRNLQS